MTGIKGILLAATAALFVSSATWAQSSSARTVKRNVATVLFSTLGGAILGLSTLPFYGEPEEHTDNISGGALVGLLLGTGYVAYSASRPETQSRNDFALVDNIQNKKAAAPGAMAFPIVQLSFDF